jgi:hypothetical protein
MTRCFVICERSRFENSLCSLLKPSSSIHLGQIIRHASLLHVFGGTWLWSTHDPKPWYAKRCILCVYTSHIMSPSHVFDFFATFGKTSNVGQDDGGHWVCQGGRCAQVWHAWFLGFHTSRYFPPKSLKCIWCTQSSNLNLNIQMSKNAIYIYASTPRKLMKPWLWPSFKV